MMLRRAIVVCFILLLSLTSLSIPGHSESEPIWTFMVYMDADNSLHSFASDDLGEMMSVGSNINLNIVVLYDSIEKNDSAIYYIERGQIEVVKKLGEVDMGSPSTLEFFLNWSMVHYPAKHYFLDFWDHGDFYGGVCEDHGDWLTLEEMRGAIMNVENEKGKRIDVIGFDACRMGIMENFYALRGLTQYVVASEKDEPASGWPYDMVLENMSNYTPKEAAINVVNSMYKWSQEYFSERGLSTTMVAVNMSEFENFIVEFNMDLQKMIPVTPYYYEQILNASRNSERYELYSDMDLYSFAENLLKIDDYHIDKFAQDTMSALNNISYYRVWKCPHPQNEIYANNSHGIGIYFPTFSVASSYYHTGFAKQTYWARFLNVLFDPYFLEKRRGFAIFHLEDGTLDIYYGINATKVEIYIISQNKIYENTTLPPKGNFTIPLSCGTYSVYIYGYQRGYVIWAKTFHINYTKPIKIIGTFYLNGHIADGARIILIVNNKTYTAVQNSTGFTFTLLYPTEIEYGSKLKFQVDYYSIHRTYIVEAESLRGNDTIYVQLHATSLLYPPYLYLLGFVAIIPIAIILWKKRARRELKR